MASKWLILSIPDLPSANPFQKDESGYAAADYARGRGLSDICALFTALEMNQ